ncbi:PIG-L family deacetylase [Pedobacter yulinensis]|uniref:PIG-L family deacetylase n=1 Tax=Pedobacter yulinensis TaxID=2126353 RepID=A0A2T3HIB3_9SPHI|nr:PIG-L family deacetylase [Pedobacter yulinensis]PST82170.1 PIG-L family deacetylase [Pedobacter yulinensis]
MTKYYGILLLLLIAGTLHAQQVRPAPAAGIFKEIRQLKKMTRVLYLAAHPDDENTGLLSWLVNEANANTAYLSLTRGDGGQNLLGSEQGPALGLIRTYELLEARKLDGAGQFFTRVIDFGFSKNPEDTFRQWDRDAVTADVVRVIRQFRPDVIICRFPPTAAAGHGQHTASAILAEDAFRAAADSRRYPEQLKTLGIWQAKRLLWNTFRFGTTNTTDESQLKITAGQYDPLLGLGYGELAGLSRSLHKSQGAGTQSVAGKRTEYFVHVAGERAASGLFDGIKQGWERIGQPAIDTEIGTILKQYDFNRPEASLPALFTLRKRLAALKQGPDLAEKRASLDRIILHCAGLMAEAVTDRPEAVPGQKLPFRLNLVQRAAVPVSLEQLTWPGQDTGKPARNLPADSLFTLHADFTLPAALPPTTPFWLKEPPETPSRFKVANEQLIGKAINEDVPAVRIELRIGGEHVDLDVPLSYKKLDPVRGDVVEPLRIVPGFDLAFAQPLYIQRGEAVLQTRIRITARQALENGLLEVNCGGKTLASLTGINIDAGRDTLLDIPVKAAGLPAAAEKGLVMYAAITDRSGRQYDRTQQLINYSHLPVLQYFVPASARLVRADLKVAVTKIGYIEGAGDLTADFMRVAGLEVTVLKESDISNLARLAAFDAIVTGVRAVNAERRMAAWMPQLLRYVEAGGTLVMQYNTLQDMSTRQLGPYPITLSSTRVTEENSPVSLTSPGHPLLNFPNKIGPEDFAGWVQERGAYFPGSWDERYQPILAMNDSGEQPSGGSVLYTRFGKGHYIYSPLAFFRQLPAGNPGAARLFFNFLSAGRK